MTQPSGGLLDALLVPLLIVLGIGALAIIVWLVWASTRPRLGAPSQAPERDPVQGLSTSEPQTTSEPRTASEPPFLVGLRRGPTHPAGATEWAIHINGKAYTALDAVPDAETRDQVVAALRALADFSRAYIQRTKMAAGSAVQAAAAPTVPSRAIDLRAGSVFPDQPVIRDLAAEKPSAASELQLPTRSVAPGATIPTIDLANEIGDIVEEMLDGLPALQNHVIRLQNVPGQGIAFVVNGIRYSELSDIPSPEVQTLIREATREWERR